MHGHYLRQFISIGEFDDDPERKPTVTEPLLGDYYQSFYY